MARRPTSLALASAHQGVGAPLQQPQDRPASSAKSSQAAGRAGKAMVAGWFDKAAVKQLRMVAVNRETTIQQQVGRALNLLFREEGLPALAQIEREDEPGAPQ
jgi:hypothetical protein